MEEKIYYTCHNKMCSNYAGMNCSCHCGDYANTCKDRVSESEYRRLKEKEQQEKDNKIKPSYYHKGSIDTIKFCIENKLGFCEGNIVKYIVRYADKNGMEDLLKVREYLNRIIESEEGKQC